MKVAQRFCALVLAVFLAAIIGSGILVWLTIRRGFSARDNPSAIESYVARTSKRLSIPTGARDARNPFGSTPEILGEARAHFADHCATCHANDGSGKTEIGQNLYPRAPDMRLPATQNLTDGEIYYTIHNGIRLTGMPAWGGSGKDDDSWKLVLFIRHLPQLTPTELEDMQQLNPKTEAERSEEQREQQFLNEGNTPEVNKLKKEKKR